MSRRLALTLALSSIAGLPSTLDAQGREPQALDGLRSVTVLVERTAPEAVAAGVDTVSLRHQAEDAVQRLGITLVPPGSRDSASGVLYVNVFAATNPGRSWHAAYVELEVMQPVTIDRTPDARFYATTWQAPVRLRVVEQAALNGEVRSALTTMLDEFSRAWSAANPPR
ncbi:MAG TPA: hypothetical protein VFZ13_08960 [Gemmatimonadales bacterium]